MAVSKQDILDLSKAEKIELFTDLHLMIETVDGHMVSPLGEAFLEFIRNQVQ